MRIIDYIVSSGSDVSGLREAYARYCERSRGNRGTPEPIEVFLFTDKTGFFMKPDTLVMTPRNDGGETMRYGIVKGASYYQTTVEVVYDDDTLIGWPIEKIKKSDIPQAVIGLVRNQLKGQCPLMKGGCDGD